MNSSHDEEETLTVLDHFESLAFSALKKKNMWSEKCVVTLECSN